MVIVSACRTAIGRLNGALAEISPGQLGAVVVREAVRRANISPDSVDQVIIGCVLSAGAGQSVGRQAAVWGGIPVTTPAYTINQVCGSGMKSVLLGAQAILSGDADTIIAGGVENMSAAPFVLLGARQGLGMGEKRFLDSMITDGLTDVFNQAHMGITAENIAEKYKISRHEQDQFACWSQNKAETAIKAGKFRDEIVPVGLPQKKGDPILFEQDEFPRFGCNLDGLAKLKPAFKSDGTVTAGNASGIGDAAAALLLMNGRRSQELGLSPLAVLRSYGEWGVDPSLMGLGPIPATRKALERAKLALTDIDLIEANEAFAVQCLAVTRELNFQSEKLNVNGGAIALGHPIGASGARILVTLLYEMQKRGASLGLATLCIGGGMGLAAILERT